MSSVFSSTILRGEPTEDCILTYAWKHSACLVGGDLYVLFGDQELSNHRYKRYICSNVYILNLKERMWRKYPLSLSPGRRSAVVFLRNEEIFVFSGMGGVQYVREVQKLDLLLTEWKTCTVYGTKPEPRFGACGEYFEDEDLDLFLTFGGRGRNYTDFADTNALDLRKLTWYTPRVKGRPPSRRNNHCSCAGRRTMFIYGGTYLGGYCNGLYILRIVSRTCLEFTELKGTREARFGSSLSLLNGKSLLLIGGRTPTAVQQGLAEVCAYLYDLEKNEWTPVEHFNSRISFHQAVKWGKDVLIVGGEGNSSICLKLDVVS